MMSRKRKPPTSPGNDPAARGPGALEETELEPATGPMRSCVIQRVTAPRDELLRFVADPAGRVVPDPSGRLPGRGLHIRPSRANLAALLKRRGLLERLGRGAVTTPPLEELITLIEGALLRRLLEAVGLARRAGALLVGLREVEERLHQGTLPLVILAGDTAHHTREKVERLVRNHPPGLFLELLDRERLGSACGHGPVAVLAVTEAGLARRVAVDAQRWRLISDTG